MNKRSPIRKRLSVAALSVLGVVFVVTLFGLYKFYRFTQQIYEPYTVRQAQPSEQWQRRESSATSPAQALTTEKQAGVEQQGAETGRLARPHTVRHELTAPPDPADAAKVDANRGRQGKGKTFLLLGVDSRQGEQARADSILLATLPPDGGNVQLLSIPRDTYVHVAGHGYTKINHAMVYGGLPLIKRTVEQFLDVPIDHTVTVDFAGFRKLVDELGGLNNVVVEKTMDYDDPTDRTHIHLRKGQTLESGKQALDYARFRHDAEADTGRMRRQQQVIRAMIQKGSEPQNWQHLFQMLEIIGGHVKTDLPAREWMHLIMTYAYTKPEQVQTMTIRGENRVSPDDHLWYFYVQEADRLKASRQLQATRRGYE